MHTYIVKMGDLMKKYIVLILAILAVVVFSLGFTDQGFSLDFTNQGNNTYNSNGISFNYSSSWQKIPNIKTQNALAGVGDPKSADKSTNNVNTLVIVQKVTMPSNMTLKQVYDDIYAKYAQDSTYQTLSDKNVTVNGLTGYENIHKVIVNGVLKKERVVWLEKNGNIYVILCGAVLSDFDGQQTNFDTVIKSFKVQ